MRRLTLAEFDVFANDPEMLAAQGYFGPPFDNSWFFEDKARHIALETDGCCIAFVFRLLRPCPPPYPWEYEMHFLFPADRRGKRAVAAAREMVRHMFTFHRADRIHGTIPRWNLAARMVIRHLGFAPVGTCSLAGKPAIIYALDKASCLGSSPVS